MRWLRREAFRTVHLGYMRVHVVSHSWGEVILAVLLTIAIFVGGWFFVDWSVSRR